MTYTTGKRTFVLLAFLALSGCGADLTFPSFTGDGIAVTIVDGDNQTGVVGEQLAEPLVVSVQSGGRPVAGYGVAFSFAGEPAGVRLEPDTAVTGDDGRAVAHVFLGPEAGAYNIAATLVVTDSQPAPRAMFEASAVPAGPDTLRAAGPTTQPGRREEPVPEPPSVLVLDRFGNPVAGAAVAWEVTVGGGVVAEGTTADAQGVATATWTLGDGAGVQKLAARVEGAHGSPVVFTAVVLF